MKRYHKIMGIVYFGILLPIFLAIIAVRIHSYYRVQREAPKAVSEVPVPHLPTSGQAAPSDSPCNCKKICNKKFHCGLKECK